MKFTKKAGVVAYVSFITLAGFILYGLLLMDREDRQTGVPDLQELRDGDIIFHTSLSAQSKAIQLATKSVYSHMGILFYKGNELFVLEAIQPVRLTPVSEWINRGENKHFVVKRLRNSGAVLTDQVIIKMKQTGLRFIGKEYDTYFGWSDDRIYCSELVWKIYKESANIEIGGLQKLKEFDLSDPLVKKTVRERYGDAIPLEEPVISPARMFDAENLIAVMEK